MPLPNAIHNVLIQRLRDGDVATVEHLLGMGFDPFDELTQTDPKSSHKALQTCSLWTWAGSLAKGSPNEVLDRMGRALLAKAQDQPFQERQRVKQVWAQEGWGLWSIDTGPQAAIDSPVWATAWHAAVRTTAVAFGEPQDAPSTDPAFWYRPAGQEILGSLAQGMEGSRLSPIKDLLWGRLIAQGVPVAAWNQRLYLASSSTHRRWQAPLAWAAEIGAWPMVERLAKVGLDPNVGLVLDPDKQGINAPATVTPLALCLRGLVFGLRMDNHRAVPAFRGAVAQAIQALIEAGADLDQPSVLVVPRNAPEDDQPPQRRHHDDERGVFCECEAWGSSPSVREVLRAWVDHPESHAVGTDGMADGVPAALIHAWRVRLDDDDLRKTWGETLTATESLPRPRL